MVRKVRCFGTIRNNTALKPLRNVPDKFTSFGTIRNNTALKRLKELKRYYLGFGTIRNNTALKPNIRPIARFQVLEPFETTQL